MAQVPKMLCAAALVTAFTPSALAQRVIPATIAVAPAPPYAIYADLVLAAPIIVDVAIRGTTRIKGAEAAGLIPGKVRFYVQADVVALLRGPQPLPPRIGFLADVALDSRGKAPNLKKARMLLFARPVRANPDQIQLVRPDSMRGWTAASDALTRGIIRESLAPDAPPAIAGFANAFHVPGALPGEGETQIFLTTTDNRPVSLSITRQPGEAPRWSVALSDLVAGGIAPPARDTLLWYRLACFLPAALPESALAHAEPQDAAIAREDYGVVMASLGRCDRGPQP